MVEVVRDTVGRHDTFNLACTSKYYEDMGYMGHINCTDNFNKELKKYDVHERKGWSAINLFFNDTATTEIYTLHIVGSVRCV